MRPLNLKLKGFTSFRDAQEIDFTDLDLFVMWGPTGSGKSSLLDAITYGLFGYVERVGNQVSQLVSHGQPRLSVELEFAVGSDVYRITRSTSRISQSKALLERREGDSWESFGDGADLVREVNKMIPELIGLDYEAFSRSVILPQGRFAEFLTGDAAKRREILTELLGLELFKRMSQRSNEIAKNAKLHLETKTELLEREYAGIDENALGQAQKNHESTVALAAAAEELEGRLVEIEKRWIAAEGARKALDKCIEEVRDAAATFEEASSDLDLHAKAVAEAEADLAAAKTALKHAGSEATSATKKRSAAQAKWGSLEDLAALRTKAASLQDARAEHASALDELERANEAALAIADEVKDAKALLTEAEGALLSATKDLEAAEGAHAAAHQRETVGALVEGLKPGDPCPVCERPLQSLPAASRAEITAARKALESARTRASEAADARSVADRRYALAVQKAEGAKAGAARCKQDVTNRKGRLDLVVAELSAVAGKTDDAQAKIESRIGELRALIEAESLAAASEEEARREVERRELAASKIGAEIDKIKTRMTSVPLVPMCARVADAAPELDAIDPLPSALPDGPDQLATIAASTFKELSQLAEELEGLRSARARELESLIEETRKTLPEGLALEPTNISALVSQARGTASQLRADAAVAGNAVKDLTDRLETKARYIEEIEGHRKEHSTYSALGRELRSDSIVQFLQAEALVALAQAATVHLQDLSSARYRLSYDDDRFFVVDAWNGDERRNVKTLSGGETFLASLALALALSEQVQFLAVTERNRLDSLFLDEGFGTLDAETLAVVVNAIEMLGSDGRLVGVITHVPELASQIPVRIEVVKSQRGSSLRRATEELAVGLA